MTVAHVFGTYVASRTEGISANVQGLCDALRNAGVDAALRASPVEMGQLNRRGTLAAGAWRAARAARAAASAPGTELVHVHAGLAVTAAAARFARRAGGPPVVLHLWNAHAGPGLPRSVPAGERAAHRLFNGKSAASLGLGWARDVVVSSRLQERQLAALGYGGRVHRVSNGVDVAAFHPATPAQRHDARRRLGLPDGGPVLLYYGHGSPWKGLHVLAEALPAFLREHRDATALVSVTRYGTHGTDHLRASLRRHGLEGRVVLRGPADVPSLHAAADLAVVPPVAAVGTACHPNVLLECMAAGLPIVATRAGTIPEVVRDGQTAVLARPDDARSLSAALTRVAGDAALQRRLGANARTVAEERFAWRVIAQRMVEVYRQLVPDGALPPATPSRSQALDRGKPTTAMAGVR